jgi:hypothetical protein
MGPLDEFQPPVFDLEQRLDDSLKKLKDPNFALEPERMIDI